MISFSFVSVFCSALCDYIYIYIYLLQEDTMISFALFPSFTVLYVIDTICKVETKMTENEKMIEC